MTEMLVKLSTEKNSLLLSAPTGRVTASVHGSMSPVWLEHVMRRIALPGTTTGDRASIEVGRIPITQMAHVTNQMAERQRKGRIRMTSSVAERWGQLIGVQCNAGPRCVGSPRGKNCGQVRAEP